MSEVIQRGPHQFQAQVRRAGMKSISKTFKTWLEAEMWRLQTELAIKNGTWVDPREKSAQLSFSDALGKYERTVTIKKKGQRQELSRIKQLKKNPLSAMAIDEITSADVSTFRDKRSLTVAPSTVLKEMALISHVFTVAIKDWGMKLENPVKNTRKPKVNNSRDRILSAIETKYLLEACRKIRTKRLFPTVVLALETAMRKGELVALDWRYINLNKRTAYLPDTKNNEARTVALSSKAIAALQSMGPKLQGSVLGYAKSDSINSGWDSAIEQAKKSYTKHCLSTNTRPETGFLENFCFHDMRHTATTWLGAKGLHPIELASMTGHKDLKMMMRYSHPDAADIALKLD